MIILSFASVSSDGFFFLTSTDQPIWLIVIAGIVVTLIGGLAIITTIKELLWPTDRDVSHLDRTVSAARAFLEWARENQPEDVTVAQAELGIALQALGEHQMSRDSEQGGITLTDAQNTISEALRAFEEMHAGAEVTRMHEHLFQINAMIKKAGR